MPAKVCSYNKVQIPECPLVSIGIITYNQVNFIRDVLTSAVEQDYENLEVVVSDDGSTDGTVDVILEFAERFPNRLIPIIGGQNLGITGNCNRALSMCKGKYIATVGGDDVLLPGKVRKQVDALESDPSSVLCCHPLIEFGKGRKDVVWSQWHSGRLKRKDRYSLKDVIDKTNIFAPTSVMFRASAVPSCGFDERLKLTSDWKFCMDLLKSGGTFVVLDTPYMRYRIHENNITKKKDVLLHYEALLTVFYVFTDNKKYFFNMLYPLLKVTYWFLRSIMRWGHVTLLGRSKG